MEKLKAERMQIIRSAFFDKVTQYSHYYFCNMPLKILRRAGTFRPEPKWIASLTSSFIATGRRAKARHIRYAQTGRKHIENAYATGGINTTTAIRMTEETVARLRSLFEKMLNVNIGFVERILYACSVCDSARERKAAVRACIRSPVTAFVT